MRAQPSTPIDPAVTETVRRLYVRPVDPERAQRDAATIAEAARLADQTRGPVVAAGVASSSRRRRMPLWRPALAGIAALVVVPGGMATAGMDLPDAVEAPYRAVGIALPNQGELARDEQPQRTTRGRSSQTPATTAPAVTTVPPSTSSSADMPSVIRAERRRAAQRREQRAAETRRRAARRAQRATPAEPATPAQPSGKDGGGATPATPASPAQPAGPQEKSATTRPGLGPRSKTTRPRTTRDGKGRGLDRSSVE